MSRQTLLREVLTAYEVDAALITFLPDVRWACGFSGSNGCLVVRPDVLHFVTDGRYREQARREVKEAIVHVPGYQLFQYIAEEGLLGPYQTVLFQAEHVTVAALQQWQEQLPGVIWKPVEQALTRAVATKTPDEIARIERAQRITEAVFDDLCGLLRPGLTEKEVAAEIVYRQLQRGAEKMSFDPIVAAGSQGALPHTRPSDERLQMGDMVVLDFGCVVDGYASDMTRTVALGEPGEEARAVYKVVLEAQRQAIEAAHAGMTTKALDAVARDVIAGAGYGEAFAHGLGHGIGLQTHEWPRISYHTDDELPADAVVTIEPGIYLPGQFGIRIEDIVVLRPDGCDNLTRAPKALTVL